MNDQLAAALKAAGVKTDSARLRALAEGALRSTKHDYALALQRFLASVQANDEALRALVHEYLGRVELDMRPPSLAGRGSQWMQDSQIGRDPRAPAIPSTPAAGSQTHSGSHSAAVASPPAPTESRAPGGSHLPAASQDQQEPRPAPAPSQTLKRAATAFARSSVFSCRFSAGAEMTFGSMTKRDAINLKRAGIMAQDVAERLIEEVPWTNDTTPLQECCPVPLAEDIWNNRTRALKGLKHAY